jgi:hypothetical protein
MAHPLYIHTYNISKYYSDVHDDRGFDVKNKFSFWKRDLEYVLLMMMVMKRYSTYRSKYDFIFKTVRSNEFTHKNVCKIIAVVNLRLIHLAG